MHFSVAAVLAFAGAVLAAEPTEGFEVVMEPGQGAVLEAGSTTDIIWEHSPEYNGETVDILLLAGEDPEHLDVLDVPIAEGIDSAEGSYEWEVPSTLGTENTYGLIIQLTSNPDVFQYSNPFEITPVEGSSNTGNSTTSAEPTRTSSAEVEEETDTEEDQGDEYDEETESSSTVTQPATTSTTFVPAEATSTSSLTSTVSPGGGAQATAGAFAVVGGLAIAALAF